jgi:hypothetical protein
MVEKTTKWKIPSKKEYSDDPIFTKLSQLKGGVKPLNFTTAPLQSIYEKIIGQGTRQGTGQGRTKGTGQGTRQGTTQDTKNQPNIDLLKPIRELVSTLFGLPQKDGFQEGADGDIEEEADTAGKVIGSIVTPIFKWMTWFCEYAIDTILITYPNLIAKTATDILYKSGGSTDHNEFDLIYKHILDFIALLFAFFVVYNWYFVMVYKDIEGNRPKIQRVNINEFSSYNQIIAFLARFILVPVAVVDYAFNEGMPYLIEKIQVPRLSDSMNRKLQFMALLVFIILFFQLVGNSILLSFSDYMKQNNNSSSVVSIMMYIAMGLYLVYAVAYPDNLMVTGVVFLLNIFGVILLFLFYILHVISSSSFAWLAGLLMCGYILMMSYFSIAFYSKFTFFQTIKYINYYISGTDEDGKPIAKDDMCAPDYHDECNPITLGDRIKDMIKWFMKNWFTYLYEIIIIIVLLLGMADYTANVSTVSLKALMVALNSFIIFVVLAVIYFRKSMAEASQANGVTMEDINESVQVCAGNVQPPDEGNAGPSDEGEVGPTDEGEVGPTDEGEVGPTDEGEVGPTDEGEVGPTDEGEVGPTDEGEVGPPNESPTDESLVEQEAPGPVEETNTNNVQAVQPKQVQQQPVQPQPVQQVQQQPVQPQPVQQQPVQQQPVQQQPVQPQPVQQKQVQPKKTSFSSGNYSQPILNTLGSVLFGV